MFFKKTKRIKELEKKVLELKNELEEARELELDIQMELQRKEWEEEAKEAYANADKCDCGGIMKPMYEEHPNWITFCSKCDTRSENSDYSPIKEPA